MPEKRLQRTREAYSDNETYALPMLGYSGICLSFVAGWCWMIYNIAKTEPDFLGAFLIMPGGVITLTAIAGFFMGIGFLGLALWEGLKYVKNF